VSKIFLICFPHDKSNVNEIPRNATSSDVSIFITTFYFRILVKSRIQFIVIRSSPHFGKLKVGFLEVTLSNAFLKSRNTTSTCLLDSSNSKASRIKSLSCVLHELDLRKPC
jgi:hypothetical protein